MRIVILLYIYYIFQVLIILSSQTSVPMELVKSYFKERNILPDLYLICDNDYKGMKEISIY